MKRAYQNFAVGSLSVALFVAGWVGSASVPQAASQMIAQNDAVISIKTFQFKPAAIEVRSGTRVTWTNTDEITHTVTSGTPESRDGHFNSPLAGKGAMFGFTFAQPGTYSYFCERHPSMRGQVRVN